MEADLGSASTPQEWLERMQNRIRERTLQEVNKQHDNFTALAVFATN
jgi:hypothetical protein